jgi:hypothetical protein
VPEYREAQERLDALTSQRQEARTRLAAVEGLLTEVSTDGAAAAAVEDKAVELLTGKPNSAAPAGPNVPALRQDHAALAERVQVLGRAIAMQSDIRDLQRSRASVLLSEAFRDEHQEAAVAVIRAAIALA